MQGSGSAAKLTQRLLVLLAAAAASLAVAPPAHAGTASQGSSSSSSENETSHESADVEVAKGVKCTFSATTRSYGVYCGGKGGDKQSLEELVSATRS